MRSRPALPPICFYLRVQSRVGEASGVTAFGGPGTSIDLTVRKIFKLSEHVQLSVAAIAYNVLSHSNFANPVADLGNSAQFGVINQTVSPPTTPYGAFAAAAEDARIIQLNGRVTF